MAEKTIKSARSSAIIKASLVGVGANVLLSCAKAFVGIMANSIAIVMDSVNNLSDALSSVITIAGTKLAGKAPDREHPMGHGRIEYLSASVISAIILYAGITSLAESVKKIIHPVRPSYSWISAAVVIMAIVVKLFLWRYDKKVGTENNSASLTESGSDALFDALIASATLAAIIMYEGFGVSIEAWLATGISCVIIRSGLMMMRDTFSKMLGERVESSLSIRIKRTLSSFEGVSGAYDLVLHNYGPDEFYGSVNIQVPDTYTADMIDGLTHRIQHEVYEKYGIMLLSVGIYSRNTTAEAAAMEQDVRAVAASTDHVLQLHGFYVDEKDKNMRFDLVVDFDDFDRDEFIQKIQERIRDRYPDYSVDIDIDPDVSD
ncbi:MAG: cation diffusion facilitator family transporter [Anaerovoracaceae bacterium]